MFHKTKAGLCIRAAGGGVGGGLVPNEYATVRIVVLFLWYSVFVPAPSETLVPAEKFPLGSPCAEGTVPAWWHGALTWFVFVRVGRGSAPRPVARGTQLSSVLLSVRSVVGFCWPGRRS